MSSIKFDKIQSSRYSITNALRTFTYIQLKSPERETQPFKVFTYHLKKIVQKTCKRKRSRKALNMNEEPAKFFRTAVI